MTAENDSLQKFLFESHHVRGVIVRLDASLKAVRERRDYPDNVFQLVGQALAAVTLLSATIKFKGSMILQVQGGRGVDPLVAQCNHQFHLRGLAHWQAGVEDQPVDNLLNQGNLLLTVLPEAGSQRYQGMIRLNAPSLAANLVSYFQQSEQLPTFIQLACNNNTAAGLFLQRMPEDDKPHSNDPQEANYWEHLQQLANTLSAEELLATDNQTLLHRLFHQETIRLFEPTPVCFRCQCAIDKMAAAIKTMGQDEAQALLQEKQVIAVTCEFCNREYAFDKVDVEQLFH